MDLVKVRDKTTGEEFATERRWVDDGEVEIIGGPEDLTADQIACHLSADAENANYHQFVGFFERLGQILVEEAGEDIAAKILRKVATEGGYEL